MENGGSIVLAGRKKIQAHMMHQLAAADRVCTDRVARVWKTMLATTHEGRCREFSSLEEYLDFRIVDTGAP